MKNETYQTKSNIPTQSHFLQFFLSSQTLKQEKPQSYSLKK